MTNQEAINRIDDVLSSDYHYNETLGYQLTSDDFDWLEKTKYALENIEQYQEINENLRTQLKTAQGTIEHLRNEIKNISEKQIPKKPIEKAHEDFNFELSHYLACPSCDQAIVNVWSVMEYEPKFCHYCGQALDWSE